MSETSVCVCSVWGVALYWSFLGPQKSIPSFLFPDCMTTYFWKSFTVCVETHCVIWSYFKAWLYQPCSSNWIEWTSTVRQSNIFSALSCSVSNLTNWFPWLQACNSDIRMAQRWHVLDRMHGGQFFWTVETNVYPGTGQTLELSGRSGIWAGLWQIHQEWKC